MSRRERQRALRISEQRDEDISSALNSIRIAPKLTLDEQEYRCRIARKTARITKSARPKTTDI